MQNLYRDRKFIRLCLAAFLMASTIELIWLALPFIIKALNGSDTAVGLCFMGQMGTYVLSCILSGLIIDKFKPHKLLLFSSASQLVVVLCFFATVWIGTKGQIRINPVIILTVLMALTGINTAFFWPVMMGWVSTGCEGTELTKRFGVYNTTWGIATMITPIIAGYLVEVNYTLPTLAAVITSILCFVLIASSKYSYKTPSIQLCPTEQIEPNELEYNKRAFVWISRIALLVTFICVGIFSSQVCILYKFELGFTESIYGWSIAIMYFFNVTVFFMMGKNHWWHYKKTPFALGTSAILLSIFIILISKSVVMQFLAAAIAGICYAFAYSSHQYYGVSGGKKRSGLMAIHEIILGIGVSIGALFGGILSDTFGRYTPYKFACILISAAAIVQIILWFSLRKKTVLKIKNLNGAF